MDINSEESDEYNYKLFDQEANFSVPQLVNMKDPEEVAKVISVNLHDPEAVDRLEDPGLVAHMNKAREQLLNTCPEELDMQATHLDNRVKFSQISVFLQDLRGEFDSIYSTLHAVEARGNMSLLKILMSNEDALVKKLNETIKNITILRRSYDSLMLGVFD